MSKMGQSLIDKPVCPVCASLLAQTKNGESVCISYTCHYGSSHINNCDLVVNNE